MAENESDLGAFLAGFVLGGIIAAGAALLLAPQSGEETREMIRERGIELQRRLEQTSTELRSKAESAIREGRERIDEVVEGTKQRAVRRKPGAAEGESPD